MKNPLLVVTCLLMSSGLFAQSQYTSSSLTQGQIKVAVYVSGILSDSYNTVLGDNLMEAFAASNKYIAVNRSDALNEILKRAQTYQRQCPCCSDPPTSRHRQDHPEAASKHKTSVG